jgi:DNA replication ATP-dependent helicase Dna2
MYKGELLCANQLVSTRKLVFSNRIDTTDWPSWAKAATDPGTPVIFVDTDIGSSGYSLERIADGPGSLVNVTEAQIARDLVHKFILHGVNVSSIGIICPYRAQTQLLGQAHLLGKSVEEGLEINTIDKFQGRDKDVIIFSLVRSNERGSIGRLLSDVRRLNVAVSRARRKLVLIGSFRTLSKGSPTLRPVFERLQKAGHVTSLLQLHQEK